MKQRILGSAGMLLCLVGLNSGILSAQELQEEEVNGEPQKAIIQPAGDSFLKNRMDNIERRMTQLEQDIRFIDEKIDSLDRNVDDLRRRHD